MTSVESTSGGHGATSNPNLSPATDPGANPTPEAAGTVRGGYPVSEVQPADLAMLSGMYGNMYGGGYGMGMGMGYGMGMGMGMGGYGSGYGGIGFPAGLGNFNTGMMTGNYITPSASPLQKQAVRAEIAEASHHGLKTYRQEWATIGGVGGAILGGLLGLVAIRKGNWNGVKTGLTVAGVGATTLGAAGAGTGFVVGEAYGENRAPKDAVYNDYLNDGTMGTYQGAH